MTEHFGATADHVRGAPDAGDHPLEYGDYECPNCAAADPVPRELVDSSRGEVRRFLSARLASKCMRPTTSDAQQDRRSRTLPPFGTICRGLEPPVRSESMTGHSPHEPDPKVVEAVHGVRDRFGAAGLRDMVTVAQRELAVAEAALAQLAELDSPAQD